MIRRLGVMIGSPGDAAAERQVVTDTILRWNAHSGRSMDVLLEPVRWETHATPGLQGRPQGMINEELIPLSDLLVAIFRSRAGSPTGVDVSGTIEEIREFMRQGKYVAVYFYEGDVAIGTADPDQLKTIREFKREIQQHGLTETYSTVDELAAKLPHHLTAIVGKLLGTTASSAKESSANPLPVQPPTKTPPISRADPSQLIVSESGRWVLLDTQFYQAESVRQSEGNWVVAIRSTSAEDDAYLSGLHPHHFGRSRPMPFAHRNDGSLVTLKGVESVSEGGDQVWTITLVPEDIEYGGNMMDMAYRAQGREYTPEDFARLRAGRILLNDPPPIRDDDSNRLDRMSDAMLESFIRGHNNPVSVEHCIVRVIYGSAGNDPERFLRLARLASIYFLKAGNAVERILELTLGPIRDGKVHVCFRGRRRKVASNVEPAVIEVEGDCPLE
jgi:hypothetical protein